MTAPHSPNLPMGKTHAGGLAALRRRRPRLLALLLGLALSAGLLAAAEAVFSFLAPEAPRRGVAFPPEYIRQDNALGYAPKPNVRARCTLAGHGKVVYDITYETDEHGRRATPVDGGEARTEFALFFGGSYTFGEGVGQRETLPYHFSCVAPQYRAYNYGFCGYGPQAMLAKLQSGRVEGEVSPRAGILVYTFIDHHIQRAIGSMFVHSRWGSRMPHYVIDADGRLVRRGNFTTGRPLVAFMYTLLGRSAICRWAGLELPRRATRQHVLLTCRIIEEAQREFERRFRSNGFFVMLYPGCRTTRLVRPILEQAGVRCVDYSALAQYNRAPYIIPGDGHPAGLAYRELAARLARDIAGTPE